MMKYIATIAFLILSVLASGQTIISGEYFFDTDPGFGAGVAITLTAGTTVDENFNINISGLAGGFHMLYIRVQDDDGDWSLIQNRPIYKSGSTTSTMTDIVAAEVFYDSDPGFGMGHALSVTSDELLDENYALDIDTLSEGFHMLYIRVQDDDGDWSLLQNRPIYKTGSTSTMTDIVAAEVFYDSDPGFGMGHALSVTSDELLDENYALDIDTLSEGFHMLYIRVQDEDGDWSLVQNRPIYKSGSSGAMIKLVAAEVFYDRDPGFGMGIPLTFAMDDTLDQNFALDIDTVSAGFHMLYIRIQDDAGRWSLVQNRPFYKAGNAGTPNIVLYETFIDNDPGFGAGTAYTSFTPAQLQESDFGIDLSGVSIGMHILYIRAQDDLGNWSMVADMPFEKTTCGNGIKDGDEEYVDCGGSCRPCTDCEEENLTIDDTPIADKRFARAQQSISSEGLITGNTMVIFQAGNNIMLMSDFEVSALATFEARIGPCDEEE